MLTLRELIQRLGAAVCSLGLMKKGDSQGRAWNLCGEEHLGRNICIARISTLQKPDKKKKEEGRGGGGGGGGGGRRRKKKEEEIKKKG